MPKSQRVLPIFIVKQNLVGISTVFLVVLFYCRLGIHITRHRSGLHVVLYADDILLLAPSVVALQRLLQACEDELCSLEMLINTKKSNCLRIGPRHDRVCVNITTENGSQLQWVDEIRYLGIFYC